jgi:hypothetical protein
VVAPERLIPATAWLKVVVAFGLSALVATWLPSASGLGRTPPVAELVVSASLIAALTVGALFLVLRFDLGLPLTAVLYAVAFNVLIVVVKFVWGPAGLYEVNIEVGRDLSSELGDPYQASIAASIVLALYVAVYVAIYRFMKRRLERQVDVPKAGPTGGGWLLMVLVIVVFFMATGGGLVILALPLFFGAGGIEYIQFVFSSAYSLAIAFALVGATSLAALAFHDVSERARVVGDAGILVAFFWLGLAFLVIYHVVWVIYIVALTALWPLRVVVPK